MVDMVIKKKEHAISLVFRREELDRKRGYKIKKMVFSPIPHFLTIMGMSNKHAKTLYRRQSMYTVLYLNIPFPHYVFLNVFATFSL